VLHSGRALRLLVAGACLLRAAPAPAQSPAPECGGYPNTYAVNRVDVAPVIDGAIDDEVWKTATPVSDLCQVDPIEGVFPSERTEFRLLYDAEHLYIAVRAYDREPHELIARQRQRDGSVATDDRISISLDTFHDRRNGYLFQINPNGARRDGLIIDSAEFRPFGVVDDRDESRTHTQNDASLDVFYDITPSLTGVITSNTNFAEATVDEVQVNLTRFSLFFPEQREFFLQDAGIFQFADFEEENGIPFFSRRIGFVGDGDDVPIRYGGR
jgi:hypothetical protein